MDDFNDNNNYDDYNELDDVDEFGEVDNAQCEDPAYVNKLQELHVRADALGNAPSSEQLAALVEWILFKFPACELGSVCEEILCYCYALHPIYTTLRMRMAELGAY